MATGAAISRSVRHSPFVQPIHTSRRAGRGLKARPASPRRDTRAFLTEKIDGIRLADSPLGRLKTEGMYDTLVQSCRRLFDIMGGGFDISGDYTLENLERILGSLRAFVTDRELDFMVVRNADNEVNFVLYNEIYCLGYRAFFFYISPAENMPEETGLLYCRFINFIAACLGISVTPEHSDNQYLYMLLNAEQEEEEDGETEKKLLDIYSGVGKHYHKFEEVSEMSIKGIDVDLMAHYEACDESCKNLVLLMMEGLELLPFMNINAYGFNPYYDGFSIDDSYVRLDSSLAILYSPDDGMDEMLLDCLNTDMNCGVMTQGWNRWLIMNPDMTKEDIDELMEDDEIPRMFINWSDRFFDEIDKWNKKKN